MIVFDVEQGSKGWHEARAGKITASMFSEVRKRVGGLTKQQSLYVDAINEGKSDAEALRVSGYKKAPSADVVKRALRGEKVGDFTEAAHRYAFRLGVERITGRVSDNDQFEPYSARRGRELEEEARLLHEDRREVLIQRCSFVCTDDELYGASADGFIRDDGCAEYKAFTDPTKLREIWLEDGIGEAMDQVQGQIWITERKYCDFCLYYPDLKDNPLSIRKVHRDDAYIASLVSDLKEFNDVVQRYQEQILGRPTGPIEIPAAVENAA